VERLLSSLHIQPNLLPSQLPHAHDASWHEVWAGHGQQAQRPPLPLASELAAAGSSGAALDLARQQQQLGQEQEWDQLWGVGRLVKN
jgi:hypothetical protein